MNHAGDDGAAARQEKYGELPAKILVEDMTTSQAPGPPPLPDRRFTIQEG